jgi:hypothetical protein
MFGRKKHQRQRRPFDPGATKRTAPILRYYKASTADKPAKRVERIKKEDGSTKKAKFDRFVKLLPQRLIFVAITGLLIINTTLSSAKVTKIDDKGIAYRTTQEYKDGVNDVFSSSLLHKSKVTVDSDSFEKQVTEKFPEVSRAVAVVPLAGRELQVNLEFSKPLLRLTTVDKQQGIVGAEGNFILLGDTSSSASFDRIPVLSLQVQPELQQGSQLLTSVETALLKLLISELDGSEPYRHKVKSVLFDVAKREMQVRFDGVAYYAKITPERESRGQVGALVATLKQLTAQSIIPAQYIDVRVEDRTFVQ